MTLGGVAVAGSSPGGVAPGSQWRDRAGFSPASLAPTESFEKSTGPRDAASNVPTWNAIPRSRRPGQYDPRSMSNSTPVERPAVAPGRFVLLMLLVTVVGLGLDHFATLPWQYVLSACTWAVLIAACIPLTLEERSRVAVVIVVATVGEIIGSIILGIYTYRLDNLPLFVPAGHGIVYLSGWRLSQTRWAAANPRGFVILAGAGLWIWGIVGLTGVLGRHDIAGFIGCIVLTAFFIWGRGRQVYAGVFFVVAFLEIYGTAIGTWYWQPEIPYIGVPNGNPPSGVASGYAFFDIAALTFGIAVSQVVRRFRRRPHPARLTEPDEAL